MPRNAKAINAYLFRKFGITLNQYDMMYTKQKGQCPICDKTLLRHNDPQGRRAAPVDHDHRDGRIRGLTCIGCNRFKIAKNTAESARKLTEYLESNFDARLI